MLDEISDEANPQRAVEARGLRSHIVNNFMGSLQSSEKVDRLFPNSCSKLMRGIQALNPSNNDFLKEDIFLSEAYGSDLQDLKTEIHQA